MSLEICEQQKILQRIYTLRGQVLSSTNHSRLAKVDKVLGLSKFNASQSAPQQQAPANIVTDSFNDKWSDFNKATSGLRWGFTEGFSDKWADHWNPGYRRLE